MATSNWAWLPPELFSNIIDRLSVFDRVSCHYVCKSWRKAAQEKPVRQPPPESPWLMFADPNKGCNFYSVADNKLYRMNMDPLPDIRNYMWIGSSGGWLVIADECSDLYLLNPITRTQIPLPSILPLPSITAGSRDHEGNLNSYLIPFHSDGRYSLEYNIEEIRHYLFSKCKAAVSLSEENSWTVMLLFMRGQRLAYARAGDDAWTAVDHGVCKDLILHDGLFYALMPSHTHYIVETWDLTAARPTPIRIKVAKSRTDLGRSYPYLAMSPSSPGKQLLLVKRVRDHENQFEYRTAGFEVYRLDKSGRSARWMRMQSLGDQTLFIGSNSCRSLSTRAFPKLKRNCIYSTDDIWKKAVHFPVETRDIGVCNLEDGTMAPCCPEDIPRLNWPPPVWITPSLR
ncbi:uncharacterized protein A4U43_C05F25920 [Asparagus officinalis]|uniref:F-box domain-containing protein n=1 Tax=Asparagus officinalis TaxID=4686 RepID=A0A5P1EZW8_ASPOF|nr:putative F-box protein At3g25750 [Asparagus officinalis]ONK69710.1 uncharacterized protein A4U43_C05F25920 [Asparagus officinalis]